MKLNLANGKVLDVVDVEETFYPRNVQGVILNIHMNSDEDIETLKDTFIPDALSEIVVGEGDDAKTIIGYTQVDSIRRLYRGGNLYNTMIDLVKAAE